mmetsp:Transcript_55666/g.172529  ORF Transcript_55666/g.172529 Transcript_55666/m.172529 type:complete len:362 (+) Transcript_55666:1222-2307(+)
MPAGDGAVHGRGAAARFQSLPCARMAEVLHDECRAGRSGKVQGREPEAVALIKPGAVLDKALHHLEVALACGHGQGVPAALPLRVHLGARFAEELGHSCAAIEAGDQEGREALRVGGVLDLELAPVHGVLALQVRVQVLQQGHVLREPHLIYRRVGLEQLLHKLVVIVGGGREEADRGMLLGQTLLCLQNHIRLALVVVGLYPRELLTPLDRRWRQHRSHDIGCAHPDPIGCTCDGIWRASRRRLQRWSGHGVRALGRGLGSPGAGQTPGASLELLPRALKIGGQVEGLAAILLLQAPAEDGELLPEVAPELPHEAVAHVRELVIEVPVGPRRHGQGEDARKAGWRAAARRRAWEGLGAEA